MYDIHALAVALRYCDVVITDREMVAAYGSGQNDNGAPVFRTCR